MPINLFSNLKQATFISRPNRFVVKIKINNTYTYASLPNTGKLAELFIPHAKLLIHPSKNPKTKYQYKVAGILSKNTPIMLDTHLTNRLVESLMGNKKIPALKGYKIIKSEFSLGNSRFDFLLEHNGKKVLCEIKTCTLFSGKFAMFPDAITLRGKRHVEELNELSGEEYESIVIFVIQSTNVNFFLPNYHTDIEFSTTLFHSKNRIKILALAIEWDINLEPILPIKKLKIPWGVFEKEAKDKGAYIVVLKIEKTKKINIGKLGENIFKPGYYCYIGSAKKNLKKRVERHRSIKKNIHWHIDYLRSHCKFVAQYPIRTNDDIECSLASKMEIIADQSLNGFGCTDCTCDSHLYYFQDDPRLSQQFQNILLYFRIERLGGFVN